MFSTRYAGVLVMKDSLLEWHSARDAELRGEVPWNLPGGTIYMLVTPEQKRAWAKAHSFDLVMNNFKVRGLDF